MEVGPPTPMLDDLSRPYWDGARNGKLVVQRCAACGRFINWPRPACRFCLSDVLTFEEMSGRGTLYSYTITRQAFHPWFVDRVPYVVATIELEEQKGLMLVANLVECDDTGIRVGMPVEVVFVDVGPELTLPSFRPVAAGGVK